MVNSDEIPTILEERRKELVVETDYMLDTEQRRTLMTGANQAKKGAVKGEDYVDEKNPQKRLQAEIFDQESTVEKA